MATRNSYPSPDVLAEGITRLGSVTAFARELGIPPRSLLDHIRNTPGLTQVVEDARRLHDEAVQADADEEARQALEGLPDEEEGPSREEVLEQELAVVSQELSETRSRLKAATKETTWEERVFNRLKEYIPQAQTRYEPPEVREDEGFDEHEFVLMFSDTHAGEVVELEATLGMNEYNWPIMLDRMAKLQKSVISYQRNRPYPVRTLWIPTLGDMLSGDIHDELKITNDRTLDEAVVDLAHDIATWLQAFKPHFERINFIGVPGNHPRRDKKPQAKLQQSNADWLLYNFIAALMRDDDQFTFKAPRSHYADAFICGRHHMLFMHGDGIRTTMPGVPWGGVVRRVTTLQAQFAKANQPINYVGMGHFHTTNAIEGVGVKTFVNGSTKGPDEYSLAAFGSGQDPAQLLLTFHPDNGITDVSYIDLAPRRVV